MAFSPPTLKQTSKTKKVTTLGTAELWEVFQVDSGLKCIQVTLFFFKTTHILIMLLHPLNNCCVRHPYHQGTNSWVNLQLNRPKRALLLLSKRRRLIYLGKIKSPQLKGVLWLFYGCRSKKRKGVKEEKTKKNPTKQKTTGFGVTASVSQSCFCTCWENKTETLWLVISNNCAFAVITAQTTTMVFLTHRCDETRIYH